MIDELEGRIIAGKYRLDSLITDGEMGPVYRGSNIIMDKPVTVKVLVPALAIDKRFVDRFLSDAKAVSQAGHPNILNLIDLGTDTRDITYAVYEEAPAETLADILKRDNSLPVGDSIETARQAARGLASAHAAGLIHGALTPEKIVIASDGGAERVKVFEFGGEPVGKGRKVDIEYAAPETYDGAKPDERSDVYSLGVILYEMLTGVMPFIGKTAAELKAKQESEPPPPLSAFRADIPKDLEPMILSAIAGDPERRYQKMQAFAEDLEMLSGGVAAATAVPSAAAASKRNIWQTAFIVLAGITVLAVALIYAMSARRTDPTTDLQADAGSLPVQPIGPATGAQEDSLAKLPALTPEEIMAFENSNTAIPPGGTLPGGDGFNAWGNGGVPPAGAPLTMGQPGDRINGDPNTGSQFMPGLDLVCKDVSTGQVIPCPTFDSNRPMLKPTPAPRAPAANANVAVPGMTPKPSANTRNPTTIRPAANTARPAVNRPSGPSGDAAENH
jgi:hypothetical protein